ncbi:MULTISPECIES: phospho-sugar glycosidase domain-containing protein [Aerococcus]|uniref:phospho-sugar glycosidase domain-containing protein n=1 Tax=Aerococcus TaxID=1375 RepID=UPI0009D73510|nr:MULTISPECIES: phospho-sugar glycosidase domain-containing protein [Aerococcus]KAA9290622.1 DUF871 domain-containing protein [Aerococcus mictus]MBU5610902.1 DUF871 domain-containing protein [Aerococcus urinae]MCY3031474.1 DUF871 domain-containing protein [Aerococcus sp. Group 1]MCY3055034.1 DUF871 domain-containing protein [Aerococcus sp. Group 1]MCY3056766.1 DUF871 domain-containing protein [Aerococcus sp. Group 1]
MCRPDVSEYVVRSQCARGKITDSIEPSNQTFRNKGSITVDNNLAGRYEGEFEIIKKDLPSTPSCPFSQCDRIDYFGRYSPNPIYRQ